MVVFQKWSEPLEIGKGTHSSSTECQGLIAQAQNVNIELVFVNFWLQRQNGLVCRQTVIA